MSQKESEEESQLLLSPYFLWNTAQTNIPKVKVFSQSFFLLDKRKKQKHNYSPTKSEFSGFAVSLHILSKQSQPIVVEQK